MRSVVCVFVALCVSVASGQEGVGIPGYPPPVPYQPQVVQQQVVNPPNPISQLPIGQWTGGLREVYTDQHIHEIRPIVDYGYPQYQPGYYPQQYQQQVVYPACQQPYYQQPCCYQQQYRPCYQQQYYCPQQRSWWYPGCNLGY